MGLGKATLAKTGLGKVTARGAAVATALAVTRAVIETGGLIIEAGGFTKAGRFAKTALAAIAFAVTTGAKTTTVGAAIATKAAARATVAKTAAITKAATVTMATAGTAAAKALVTPTATLAAATTTEVGRSAALREALRGLQAAAMAFPGVVKVSLADDALDVISKLKGFVGFYIYLMSIVLLFAAILLIWNTIRTAMYARRREIEVMTSTPSMPASDQARSRSGGLSDSMNQRTASAP